MSVAACGGGMGDDDKGGEEKKMRKGLALILDLESADDQDDNDDDNDKMEEDHKIAKRKKSTALRRLTSPQASQSPKRRGISRHYTGESKSFENLMEMGIKDASELGKKEHPVNMMRRILIANKNRQKSPLSKVMSRAASLPTFQPMINEEKGEGDHDNVEKKKKKKKKEEEEEEEEDDSKNQEDGN